jgi:hypothetical protein
MISDPIVEEVRTIRDEIAKECGYDIDAIFRPFGALKPRAPPRTYPSPGGR